MPSADPSVPSGKEGHGGLDFAEYVASIDEVPGTFDLVVIDGRAREACLALPWGDWRPTDSSCSTTVVVDGTETPSRVLVSTSGCSVG